jgi:hypothetical protein
VLLQDHGGCSVVGEKHSSAKKYNGSHGQYYYCRYLHGSNADY